MLDDRRDKCGAFHFPQLYDTWSQPRDHPGNPPTLSGLQQADLACWLPPNKLLVLGKSVGLSGCPMWWECEVARILSLGPFTCLYDSCVSSDNCVIWWVEIQFTHRDEISVLLLPQPTSLTETSRKLKSLSVNKEENYSWCVKEIFYWFGLCYLLDKVQCGADDFWRKKRDFTRRNPEGLMTCADVEAKIKGQLV